MQHHPDGHSARRSVSYRRTAVCLHHTSKYRHESRNWTGRIYKQGIRLSARNCHNRFYTDSRNGHNYFCFILSLKEVPFMQKGMKGKASIILSEKTLLGRIWEWTAMPRQTSLPAQHLASHPRWISVRNLLLAQSVSQKGDWATINASPPPSSLFFPAYCLPPWKEIPGAPVADRSLPCYSYW